MSNIPDKTSWTNKTLSLVFEQTKKHEEKVTGEEDQTKVILFFQRDRGKGNFINKQSLPKMNFGLA